MALKMTDKKFQFGGLLTAKVLCIALMIISLILVVVYAREGEQGPLHSIQDTTSAIVSPLSSAGTTVGSLAVSASTSVEDLTASDASMSQLRDNNAQLSQMVVELEEYRQEAVRLEAMLGLSDAYGFESVSCRVVGYSADSYNKIITLDAGSNAGVTVGLPVMGSTGVVGQVISVTPVTSEVRLLTDAQSGISVLVQSSRAEGILTGSVDGSLYLEGISDTVEVKEGDAIITSGLGGGYFRGLVVGVVSKVEQHQGDATRTIVVRPNASFDNISEVLVVLGMSNEGAATSDASAANSLINKVDPSTLQGSSHSTGSSNTTSNSGSDGSDSGNSGTSDSSGSDSSGNSDNTSDSSSNQKEDE